MRLHVQVSRTAMILDPSEPESQAIANLPGYMGPDRQYLMGRTRSGNADIPQEGGPLRSSVEPR